MLVDQASLLDTVEPFLQLTILFAPVLPLCGALSPIDQARIVELPSIDLIAQALDTFLI